MGQAPEEFATGPDERGPIQSLTCS